MKVSHASAFGPLLPCATSRAQSWILCALAAARTPLEWQTDAGWDIVIAQIPADTRFAAAIMACVTGEEVSVSPAAMESLVWLASTFGSNAEP